MRCTMVRQLIGSILQRKASYTTVDRGAGGIIPVWITVRDSTVGPLNFDGTPASIAGHQTQTTLASSATKPSTGLGPSCDADRRAAGR
jgi:hypothetical protein